MDRVALTVGAPSRSGNRGDLHVQGLLLIVVRDFPVRTGQSLFFFLLELGLRDYYL